MRNYRRKGEKLSDKVEFRLSERDKNKRNDWKTVLHAAPEEKCHTNLPSHTCILAYSLILSQIGQEANVKGRVTTFDTPPFSFAGDKQLTFSATAPYIVREFQLLSRNCSVSFLLHPSARCSQPFTKSAKVSLRLADDTILHVMKSREIIFFMPGNHFFGTVLCTSASKKQ